MQMIPRRLGSPLLQRLSTTPAVALLGSGQVGKTTLARELKLDKPNHYIDLERPSDLAKLADPELYLGRVASAAGGALEDELGGLPGGALVDLQGAEGMFS